MAKKLHEISFSELALALSDDYESVFVIDSTNDNYVEYVAEGGEKELSIRMHGDNFFEDVPKNAREMVWPEDRQIFIKAFKKSNFFQVLDDDESFRLNYRLIVDGKPQYYHLKTIRKNDKDIIVGVQNVDKQIRRELKERESKKIFSEIAESLGSMFEVIYHININTGHYTEYYSSSSFSELEIESGGNDDFFEKLKTDIRVYIYEEDREMLINELTRENLINKLKDSNSYSIVYRQILDGRMQYVNLIVFKQKKDDEHLVIGVRNIDEQKRQEAEITTYSHIAGALASRYEVIYYIDVDTNEYIQYSSSEQYAKLGTTKKGEDFFKEAAIDIKKYIHEDDKERILRVMQKKHLLDIMAQEGALTLSYRQLFDGQAQYVALFVVRPKNDEKHLIIGVTNIDAQVRREETIKEEGFTFNEIAMALAQRYEAVYQVNILTNEYLEFNAKGEYAKLDVGAKGNDFFAETQENMKKAIFPDDYPMMKIAMQKEFLLEALKETGKFILNYRLIIDGRPQYAALIAVRPKTDSEHIIVAVANIDSARKMELEFGDALDSAMDMANNDPLTGLKNKRYYAQVEMRLDNEIESKSGHNFAILLCDINGLKEINDTKGHKAGDKYIQEAGKMLKSIFANNIIFRYGGDEFIIILEEENYKRRDELIDRLAACQKENRAKNLVTVSYGISEYQPMLDNRVQDVFERADQAMYLYKKHYQDDNEDDQNYVDDILEIEKDQKFYELFEKLISKMTAIDEQDIPAIEKLLIEISSMLRLSKAVTRLYKNPGEEAAGGGETLCCYDTGLEGKEIKRIRIVSKVMSIATMTAYMSSDEKPLSEKEEYRLELLMRTTLTYVSRNRIRDMVEELTYYDDVGYKNLRSYQKYITQNMDKLRTMVALMYNLRHFSLINRELSNETGDIIMNKHFHYVESLIGDRGIVCRLGGDNFVALCGNERLGTLLTALNESTIVYDEEEGKSVNISCSVGVCRLSDGAPIKHPGHIMEKIIIAFHAAQTGGKESIVFYNGGLIDERANVMKVQQLFPAALRDEEFRVYYQPKVDVRTGKIIGAEALCRWFHDGSMISPGAFIPMLEETNDICKLDFYMLDHVCKDIRRWLDMGRKVVRISVNLSRKHMINVNLLDNLLKIIDRHNVPHSCIEIELTETTTDVEFNDLKRVVRGLQNAGIYTSVDDFGVGYSSLNLIKELPWNVIKVDRSFLPVEGDELDNVSKVMFKHVIAMTNEMGIECIVEGVETETQLNMLRENNCYYAQGFLFDRPLPKKEFETKLMTGYYQV